MSIYCEETGEDFKYGDVLMVGTRGGSGKFYALSQKVLKRIPKSSRRKTPRKHGEGGLDIHHASSTRGLHGYNLFDFKHGEFAYSISKKTTKKYLPNYSENH